MNLEDAGRLSKEAMEEALRANPFAAAFCGRTDLSTPEQIEEVRQWQRDLWPSARFEEPKS